MDSTTRAFNISAPSKFSNFKIKNAPAPAAPGTSAPTSAIHDDLLDRMAIDVKNSTSNGNRTVIDFIGDQRPIVMALCFYAASFYDALDVKQSSKVSPPTMVAYFLFLIHSFYLFSDLEARPTPSAHTRFISTPEYIELKALFLSLPVPTFMLKFFQAITPASDPRRPNIDVVPSYACFSSYHDYGRIFPISIFIIAHNFVLKHKTNDIPETLMIKLFTEKYHGTAALGNLFGQLMTDGTYNYSYKHQLAQAFEGIVNPALARARSQRNVYSRITQHVPAANAAPNPYQFFMNCDEDNISETMTLMRQLSTTISAKLPCSGTLGAVASTLTGLNIMIHSYSLYATPTWHYTSVTANADSEVPCNGKSFAQQQGFLQAPSFDNSTELKYPEPDTTINKIFYLIKKVTKTENYPATTNLDIHKGRADDRPPYRVLDPYDYNAATFHNVYLSGAIIESREIDGHAVPLPDSNLTLDDENTQFLQSALPLSDIMRATNFKYRADPVHWFERRFPTPEGNQKCATLLYDISENRLPQFDLKMIDAVPSELPGFHPVEHISTLASIFSKIGFRQPTFDDQERSRPNIPTKGKFLLWSPYRFDNGKVMTSHPENIFMLANLRTIFGTNPPLGETAHFLDTMPV